MKIAVISYASSCIYGFTRHTIRNHVEYAIRNEYAYIVESQHIGGDERTFSWDKIYYLHRHLNDFDAVLWIDADAMVMNMNQRIEDLFVGDKEIIITADQNGLNAGVILMKKCARVLDFLYSVYNNNHVGPPPYYDQFSIVDLYDKNEFCTDLR